MPQTDAPAREPEPDPRQHWRDRAEEIRRQRELDEQQRQRTLAEIAYFNQGRRRRGMA